MTPKLPTPWHGDLTLFHEKYEPHRLYRCYDDGLRLYIGCTVDSKRRMVTHAASRRSTASVLLQRFMASHEVDADAYPGSLAGHAAEQAAIRAEHPLFNQQHTGVVGWMKNLDIAEYLLEHTGRHLPVFDTGTPRVTVDTIRALLEDVAA